MISIWGLQTADNAGQSPRF